MILLLYVVLSFYVFILHYIQYINNYILFYFHPSLITLPLTRQTYTCSKMYVQNQVLFLAVGAENK